MRIRGIKRFWVRQRVLLLEAMEVVFTSDLGLASIGNQLHVLPNYRCFLVALIIGRLPIL